jgi:hypothetical protein
MTKRTQRAKIHQAIRMVFLLVTVSAGALANESPTLISSTKSPLCYCHCEQMNGGKQCTKMCELPQYENRWWAASCHKKSTAAKDAVAPAPNSGSRKTNRTEEAKLSF